MRSQKIAGYMRNTLESQQCKTEILLRMKAIKNKIDLMQNQQKFHHEDRAHVFVQRFKRDLNFLLVLVLGYSQSQFQLFKNVVTKLERENYQRFSQSTQMLIKVIRQQMMRFHSLIPPEIQEQFSRYVEKGTETHFRMTSSTIQEDKPSSSTKQIQVKEPIQNPVNTGNVQKQVISTKVEQIKEQTNQDLKIKPEETDMNINIISVESEDENSQILKNLQQFLLSEDQNEDKQNQSESQTEPFIQQAQDLIIRQSQRSGHESVIGEQLEAQQKEQRKRYTQFIQAQRKKAQRSPIKIAGKVLLCLLILAAIFLTLASVVVYKVVKAIAGQL